MIKKRYVIYVVTALLFTASAVVVKAEDPFQGWNKLGKKDGCPKPTCPIVEPLCPPFIGTNGFEVTDPGDDENSQTLRAAINAANASNASPCNPFVIVFNLDNGTTIQLDSPLPEIKKAVCINGFTQPGADECKRIVLVTIRRVNGIDTSALILTETACGSTIKGLSILGFMGDGTAAILVRASCSLIAGNNLGDVDEIAFGTGNANGIIVESAEHVTIGGLCPQARNVIGGNARGGIKIESNHVSIVGNYIGTDVTGRFERGNRTQTISSGGIFVRGDNNTIGCDHPCGGNLIADNLVGIDLEGSCNTMQKNMVGLDRDGERALGSQAVGIRIVGTSNLISKSIVSGNTDNNIEISGYANVVRCSIIGTNSCGSIAFPSDYAINIGESDATFNTLIEDNLIAVREGIGITASRSMFTTIRNNRIGVGCDARCPLGQAIGIDLASFECAFVGPAQTETRMRPKPVTQALENMQNKPYNAHTSYRAEPPTGTCEKPCGECQLDLLPPGCCAVFPFLGNTASTCIKKNLIVGNDCAGIRLSTSIRFTTIEDNFIGVTKECCFVPNGYGIFIENGAQNNTIKRNLIAGNTFNGIGIQGLVPDPLFAFFSQTWNNSIIKNRIFCNGGSGIRLAAGGNACLGAPLITEATVCDDKIDVTIDAASLPEAPFTIELYGNTQCRKCISEGELFLCCKTVKNPNGADIKLRVVQPCPEIKFVSATVTELTSCFAPGNTSEFSCPVKLVECIKENRHEKLFAQIASLVEHAELKMARETTKPEDVR